jgi:hypothetical protein
LYGRFRFGRFEFGLFKIQEHPQTLSCHRIPNERPKIWSAELLGAVEFAEDA